MDKDKLAAAGLSSVRPVSKKSLPDNAPKTGQSDLIGNALKSVYQSTVNEDIPLDFAELLNRLK